MMLVKAGWTTMHSAAARNGNKETVEALLAKLKGAAIWAKDKVSRAYAGTKP